MTWERIKNKKYVCYAMSIRINSDARLRMRFLAQTDAEAEDIETQILTAAKHLEWKEVVVFAKHLQREIRFRGKVDRKKLLISDLSKEYFESEGQWNLSGDNYRNCLSMVNKHIVPRIGNLTVADIKLHTIESFKKDMRTKKYSDTYIFNVLRVLKRIINWGIENDLVSEEAKPKIVISKKTKRGQISSNWLIPDEEKNMIDYLSVTKEPRHVEMWPMILLSLRTGCRQGEVRALRLMDLMISDTRAYVVFRRSARSRVKDFGPTKSGENRVVPISRSTVKTLAPFLDREDPEHLIFPGPTGPAFSMSRFYMNERLQEIVKEVGLTRRFTWHGFRHTFGTRLLAKGHSLRAVQELLGHEDVETTKRYTHVRPEDKIPMVESLDEFDDIVSKGDNAKKVILFER